ncbi:MAG: hypothetical protein MJY62_04215 [Bacteroidales bacterium]|nr:hypothetical protein [Bacteroidales bacterium]
MAKQTKTAPVTEEVIEKKAGIEEILTKYSKVISICFAAAVVIAALIFCYVRFIQQPKRAEALADTFNAEYTFAQGDFATALEGTEDYLGFADVIDTYGCNAPKAAYLYAGVCELQAGNFEEALAYLRKYNGTDPVLKARALCCKGDAYVGLEQYSKAVSCYKAAAKKAGNLFAATYIFKEGLALETLGKEAEALKCYKTIKEKYPMTEEGYDIEKYIARIEYK